MITIAEQLADIDPDILLADGFDAALIGYVEIFTNTIALYSREKYVGILMEQGMTYQDAEEYFAFNVIGAYVGEKTPAFATFLQGDDIE